MFIGNINLVNYQVYKGNYVPPPPGEDRRITDADDVRITDVNDTRITD